MASMVTTGGILADIGTDHAYVPIALVQRQKIKGAIAMDINEGPLARAQEHIRAARLEEYIQTRLRTEQRHCFQMKRIHSDCRNGWRTDSAYSDGRGIRLQYSERTDFAAAV